jgi:hypothetical protein
MMAWFDQLRGGGYRGAALTLSDGKKVHVTLEDHLIAQQLADRMLVPPLLPGVGGEKASQAEKVEILAALRRLAIEYGIEGSPTETREAIRHVLEVWPKTEGQPTPQATDLPRMSGLSGDQYDLLQSESLRIATFLRMFAFAADTSDAQLAEKLAQDAKMITCKVATLDKKLIEDTLKQTEVSDDDLKAWLASLTDAEKAPYQDTNRVGVKAAGVKLAEFDPAAFAVELKDKQFDDKAIEARYNLDRDLYHRKEVKEGEPAPADPYLPLADVKDAVVKRLQADAALTVLVEKLRAQMGDMLRPAVDARNAKVKELAQAKAAQAEADKKLAEKPEDEALKKAAADAKAAVDAADKAHKDAETAVDTARRAFDLESALAQATTAKLSFATIPEPKNADGLKELPEFGPWDSSWSATSMDLAGDICARVQHSKTAAFLFQILDVVKTPLKEFTAIKDKLKEDYYKKKADEQGKATLTKFEDAMKRLAKEAKKADIDKLEADLVTEVNKKFDDWKTSIDAEFEKAKQMVAQLGRDMESKPYKRWQQELERAERERNDAEAKRKAIEAEARKEVDKKIDDLVKAARKDVLVAAAAEAGMTLETIGPERKDADQQPRFQEDRPARERFLLSNYALKQLKEGEATDMLEDFTNRAHYMAVMEKIEPGSLAMLSRRELFAARERFVSDRAAKVLAQSFTLEALQQGWGYARLDVEPDTNKSAKATPETGAGSAGAAPANAGGNAGAATGAPGK